MRRKNPRIAHYELPDYNGPYKYGLRLTTSQYLIYGLTDPDTGKVRYIGRSFTGLMRAQEHVMRITRERTYKANWIRKLLSAGKMYGVRVLEECSDRAETIGAEIRWIREGRRLGWALTNLTDGGEGAAGKKIHLPDAEVVRLYLEGTSELELSKRFRVNRYTITRRLLEFGIIRRNRSEAMYMRQAHTPPEERMRLAKFAHAGCKAAHAKRRQEIE